MTGSFLRNRGNELSLVIAILAVVVFTTLLDPAQAYRRYPDKIALEILHQTALLGIFALGAAVVILAGGIDLSSGSVIAFSGTMSLAIIYVLAPTDAAGRPIMKDLPVWIVAVSIAGTLFLSVMIGSFHAWLIAIVGLPPFVATLASLVGLRSLARVLTTAITKAVTEGSETQFNIQDTGYRFLGDTWWVPLLIFLVLSAVLWVVLNRTVLGRQLYALGGNEEAAKLSGIRTERLKWIAYCIGSGTAALAGILWAGKLSVANPSTLGLGKELDAIACAVVGGVSLQGGSGTVLGTMLGALFLRVVMDSVTKLVKTQPGEFQGLIVGVLVVLAVALNSWGVQSGTRTRFFTGWLGTVNLVILSLLLGTIAGLLMSRNNLVVGASVAGILLVVFLIKKRLELRKI